MADKTIASLKATVKVEYKDLSLKKLKQDLTTIDKRLKNVITTAKQFGNVLNSTFTKPRTAVKLLTKEVRSFNSAMTAGAKAQDNFTKDRANIKFNRANILKVKKDLDDLDKKLRTIVTLSKQAFITTSRLKEVSQQAANGVNITNNKLRKQIGLLRTATVQVEKYERASSGSRRGSRKRGGKSDTVNIDPRRPLGVTARVENGFLRSLGAFRTAKGLMFELGGMIASMTLAIPALSATFLFLTSKINGATTEMSKLSKATGVSMGWMQGMTAIAKELGFNFENINSLVEELNNKVGGQLKGFDEINLIEGLSHLELTFQDIKDLKPEEQFNLIAKRTQELARSGVGIQELGSAWDKIFGGEGNRIGANIALMKEDFTVIQKRMEAITKLSDTAVEGAERYTRRFNELTAIMARFAQEFFGKFGSQMAPILKDLVDFLLRNSKEIVSFLSEASVGIANILGEAIEYMRDVLMWGLKNREMFMGLIGDARQWLWVLTRITTAMIYLFELAVKLKLTNPWTWLAIGALKYSGILTVITTILKGLPLLLGAITGTATGLGVGASIMGFLGTIATGVTAAIGAIAASIPALIALVIAGLYLVLDTFFPEFTARLRKALVEMWFGFVKLLQATFMHIPSLFWNGMVDGIASFVTMLADGVYSALADNSIMNSLADAGDWIKDKYKQGFGSEGSSGDTNNTTSTVNNINNSFSLSGQDSVTTMRRMASGGIQ